MKIYLFLDKPRSCDEVLSTLDTLRGAIDREKESFSDRDCPIWRITCDSGQCKIQTNILVGDRSNAVYETLTAVCDESINIFSETWRKERERRLERALKERSFKFFLLRIFCCFVLGAIGGVLAVLWIGK